MASKESAMIAKALLVASGAMRRLNISRCSLPRARLRIFSIATAKVVVLMPPPVEPGDEPIHIIATMTSNVLNESVDTSTLAKPAERGVLPIKNAVTHLPNGLSCACRLLLYSSTKVATVAPTTKKSVDQATRRELKLITQALCL